MRIFAIVSQHFLVQCACLSAWNGLRLQLLMDTAQNVENVSFPIGEFFFTWRWAGEAAFVRSVWLASRAQTRAISLPQLARSKPA